MRQPHSWLRCLGGDSFPGPPLLPHPFHIQRVCCSCSSPEMTELELLEKGGREKRSKDPISQSSKLLITYHCTPEVLLRAYPDKPSGNLR